MPRIQHSIQIASTPERVFPWLIEPDKLALWIGGFVGSEPITTDGALVGARSRDMIREGKRTLVLETVITELEAPHTLAVTIDSRYALSKDRYRLEEDGRSTRLEYSSDVSLRGLSRLISPLIVPQLRARARDDLERLRQRVESGTT